MEYETKYLDETKWRRELETLTEEYERMLAFVDRELATAPEGRLVIQSSRTGNQYYRVNGEGKHYLPKTEMGIIKALASKAYYLELKEVLDKQIRRAHYILEMKPLKDARKVYEQLREERQVLIDPLCGSSEEFVNRWLEESFEPKIFDEGTPAYYAKNGLRVRSKSEATIVDLLLEYGIPFKYERPLTLKGMGEIHPDFVVLNKRTGEEFVWEHFGKVDDWKYANDMVRRIEAYHFNGFYEGKNLIYTLESSKMPFGAKDARRIIEQYLL